MGAQCHTDTRFTRGVPCNVRTRRISAESCYQSETVGFRVPFEHSSVPLESTLLHSQFRMDLHEFSLEAAHFPQYHLKPMANNRLRVQPYLILYYASHEDILWSCRLKILYSESIGYHICICSSRTALVNPHQIIEIILEMIVCILIQIIDSSP